MMQPGSVSRLLSEVINGSDINFNYIKMRRKTFVIFAAAALFLAFGPGNFPALAAGYEPLVSIPGVKDAEVDISSYLKGIYNFLLSIVGIVSVVMLIIGGMKYITAAGSGGAVSSAKETIKNAILGLLLALLSYVIISTINPDVLYIKQIGYALVQGKDQNIGKSQNWITTEKGETLSKQDDGSWLYTDARGVTVLIEDNAAKGEDADELAQQIAAGTLAPAYTEEQLVGAMERMVSCIAAGSPSGINDPNYHGKCVCAVGNREVVLQQSTVDAGGGCSEECEMKGLCGYKFLSVKLNARHGYDANGAISGPTGAGSPVLDSSAAPDDSGQSAAAGQNTNLPEYTLTSDTAIHADELWEMHATNDPKWGDFDIEFAKEEVTNSNGQTSTREKRYYYDPTWPGQIYPCAILVTNEEEYAVDEHFVYWVPLGTVVGGNENSSLYYDLNGNYRGGCGNDSSGQEGNSSLFKIAFGECDQAWTDRVMLAKYSDKIVDKCEYCDLADEGSIGKAYRWARSLTCRGGYWQ